MVKNAQCHLVKIFKGFKARYSLTGDQLEVMCAPKGLKLKGMITLAGLVNWSELLMFYIRRAKLD